MNICGGKATSPGSHRGCSVVGQVPTRSRESLKLLAAAAAAAGLHQRDDNGAKLMLVTLLQTRPVVSNVVGRHRKSCGRFAQEAHRNCQRGNKACVCLVLTANLRGTEVHEGQPCAKTQRELRRLTGAESARDRCRRAPVSQSKAQESQRCRDFGPAVRRSSLSLDSINADAANAVVRQGESDRRSNHAWSLLHTQDRRSYLPTGRHSFGGKHLGCPPGQRHKCKQPCE